MLLDFTLTRNVIGEEVAGDAYPDVRHPIALAEEAQEERDYPRVGVRELHRIARPRSFGPEKHAAGDVEEVACSRATGPRLETPAAELELAQRFSRPPLRPHAAGRLLVQA